ncbi:hypothetical protein ALC57_14188, partial [Trachymyrmex cornetzi]
GSTWARCPVAAAKRIAAEGRLIIGWTRCWVEILPQRPLQCFRCLGMGHVRAACPSMVDRSNCCYRYGTPGHTVRNCASLEACCPLYRDAGEKALDHRAGSGVCPLARRRGRPVVPTGRVPLLVPGTAPAIEEESAPAFHGEECTEVVAEETLTPRN